MNAQPALHPTDQTLHAYGLGKLDDASAESVNAHLEALPRLPPPRRRALLRQLPRPAPRRQGPARFAPPRSSPRIDGLLDARRRPRLAGTAPGQHPAPGLADHPDYEILRELGQRRHGRRLPGPEHAHGPAWRSSRSSAATSSTAAASSTASSREIRNAARLHHPNIVTAYSALRLGESLVLAMEYVEGLDLAKLVKAKGPLPVANACNFVHQAALGLQHAHEHGMVHRDIKPGNLMLAREGKRAVVKVLDFGLAKVTERGPVDGGLTHEGQMLGTPDYIAPEQIRDAQHGRHPRRHLQPGLHALLPPDRRPAVPGRRASTTSCQAHHSMDATPLNLVRPEVPVELAALVAKMMAKEPERRFQTPEEVAQALTPFFKSAAEQPPGSSAEVSRVNPPVPPTQASGSPARADRQRLLSPPLPRRKRMSSKTEADGVAWESLIEIKEDEPLLNVVRPKPANPKQAEPKRTHAEGPVRRPPGMWPAIAAASLFGLFALGVIVIAIRGENGETKITARDDRSFKLETPDVVVEHNPSITNPRSPGHSDTPETPPAVKPRLSITNSIGMKLALIPAGEFTMGSPDSDRDADPGEKPQHQVRITRSFYLGVHEVTQAQYVAVMGVNPSWFSANGGGKDRVAGQSTDRHPVESVSWLDSVKFCNKLSEKEGLKMFYEMNGIIVRVPDWNGLGYRLPTEAEWEYACRARQGGEILVRR